MRTPSPAAASALPTILYTPASVDPPAVIVFLVTPCSKTSLIVVLAAPAPDLPVILDAAAAAVLIMSLFPFQPLQFFVSRLIVVSFMISQRSIDFVLLIVYVPAPDVVLCKEHFVLSSLPLPFSLRRRILMACENQVSSPFIF